MLFFDPITRKILNIDDTTGIVSSVPVLDGNSIINKPSGPEKNDDSLQEAMFRVLLILSSTLFSSMVMWTASPEEKNKMSGDEAEDQLQVSKGWEESIDKVAKMINKDEEIADMELGKLIVGLIGWVERVVITTWGKSTGGIGSSAMDIIKGAPKRVVDLILLELSEFNEGDK